ncbi:hypothetical protein B0189_09035 [Moraxella cuniculi]|nr:hypothetical protein B0189_09035 [Moraxella cuniculi]
MLVVFWRYSCRPKHNELPYRITSTSKTQITKAQQISYQQINRSPATLDFVKAIHPKPQLLNCAI